MHSSSDRRLARSSFSIGALVSVAILAATAVAGEPAPAPSAGPSAGPSAAPPAAPSAAPPAAPSGPPPAQEAPPSLEARAKAHFDRGRKLLAEGACAAAIPEFLESRRLFPSRSATSSAAVCLRKVQRYDEALDLFEALLLEFPELPADVKSAAQRQIIELRGLVGTIEITGAEPGAAISVDGQARGEHPTLAPLRVSAGGHLVRVYKEGFEPSVVRVDVRGQETTKVPVRLVRLVQAGKLRVEEASGAALDVVIDGTVVGSTPWEGAVAAGEHSLVLRGADDLGTLPRAISIQANKRASLSLAAERLDATLEIVPAPVDGSVAVDGIFVGRGAFRGRLRPGKHAVEVIADGYFPAERTVAIERGAATTVAVPLVRDPSSPAWRKPGRFGVEIMGSAALTPSFGGEVAECSSCNAGLGAGGRAVVHGSFETWTGFGFGASFGYLTMQQKITDRATTLNVIGLPQPDQGTADDTLTLRAFQLGAWGGYRLGPERVPIRLRLGAGVLLGSMADRRTGVFRSGGKAGACAAPGGLVQDTGCFHVGPVAEAPPASFFYVAPEVRAGFRLGEHVELSIGVEAMVLVGLDRPRWNADSPAPNQDHPINASKDGYGTFASETLAGMVSVAILPGAAVRYEF